MTVEKDIQKALKRSPKPRTGRPSRLSRYSRELMILEIVEMLWTGVQRKTIVKHIHETYGYQIRTIDNLLSEAMIKAADIHTPEEKRLVFRQLAAFHHNIIFSDDEPTPVKQKSADLYAKLMRFYNPDVAIQVNNYNIDAGQQLDDQTLNIIEERLKNDEK